MRAMVVDDFVAGQFRLAEVERPAPAHGEVLVRIQASGVNPLDSKIRVGMAPHAQMKAPAILGTDLAGLSNRLARVSIASMLEMRCMGSPAEWLGCLARWQSLQ